MSKREDQRLLVKQLCRELRKNATKGEQIFWEAVRNRRFRNRKFNRQYPIFFEDSGKRRFFIADFYCHEENLVVEIDGKIHDYQKDRDEIRSNIINLLGMKVIRFKNEEIENDIREVLDRLERFLNSPLAPLL